MRKTVRGSLAFPLVDQIVDAIRAHGAEWAIKHYAALLPEWEGIFFLRVALARA